MAYKTCFYLDTTFTRQDPFFKKNFSKKLVELSMTLEDCIIVMSSVVYEESKKKIVEQLSQLEGKLKADAKSLADLLPEDLENALKTSIHDVTAIVTRYEEFIHNLEISGTILILDPPDGIMPELIKRAIYGIKPFGNNKDEFRDAVTWFTYTRHAESLPNASHLFVTNNTTDFYDDSRTMLHPDLVKDCDCFIMYKTTREMFQNHKDIPKLEASARAHALYDEITNLLSSDWILAILQGKLAQEVLDEISSIVEGESLDHWSDYANGGWVSVDAGDVIEAKEDHMDLDTDTVTVFGTAKVYLNCTGFYYNPVHDNRDDKFDERDMEFEGEISFLFRVVSNGVYDNFEIYDHDISCIEELDDEFI